MAHHHNHNHGHSHGNSHGHEHHHGHNRNPSYYNQSFAIGIALNLGLVIVEAVYGTLAHSVATTENVLTAHLVMLEGHPGDQFLAEVCQKLHEHFGIGHSTLQIEMGNTANSCLLAPDHIV